jgi:glycosyltransferase involved in cell wall biosynthesis
MRVVIDAVAALESSYTIIVEGYLRGWQQLGVDDELHLVVGPQTRMDVPDSVIVHRVDFDRPRALPGVARRIVTQTTELQRIARSVRADALLATIPASAMRDVGVPRVAVVYDMRHELRPGQFPRGRRLQRAISYGYGYRAAAAIVSISERTRRDLLGCHPGLADKPMPISWLGADHVDEWPRPAKQSGARPYALAFGHYGNKNVDEVVGAWAELVRDHTGDQPVPQLTICGLSKDNKVRVAAMAAELGIADDVRPLPWVTREEFTGVFAGADMIVFPSDFEGFGIPAAEAMRLGIPLVISSDPALVEVAAGHAVIAPTLDAPTLAHAVRRGFALTAEQLAAAQQFARRYTWKHTAGVIRQALADAAAAGPTRR